MKSEFTSALGIMFGIWKLLQEAVFNAGGSDLDLRRIEIDSDLCKKLAALIVEKPAAVITAAFQQLLDACHQDGYRNPDFTESRWPLEPIATDEADWEVVEHYLTKTGTLEEGVKQLEKLAVKGEIRLLTGSRRAMEYIAQHQEAQLNHPIILPLRAQDSSDDWCLPVFFRNWSDGQRRLGLCSAGAFGSGGSWLVLRPKSSDGASKRQK